mgnify:CR=1 FL=1
MAPASALSVLRRQLDVSADPVLADLLEELREYPAPARGGRPPDGPERRLRRRVMIPFRLVSEGAVLSFFSTTTGVRHPLDITLSELALEASSGRHQRRVRRSTASPARGADGRRRRLAGRAAAIHLARQRRSSPHARSAQGKKPRRHSRRTRGSGSGRCASSALPCRSARNRHPHRQALRSRGRRRAAEDAQAAPRPLPSTKRRSVARTWPTRKPRKSR